MLRAASSAIHGRVWSNFKLFRDFMVVLVICKNEVDPIKNEDARMFTKLYINFSDAQGQITKETVVVNGRYLNFIQAFMHVLLTCKNEGD